MLDAAIVGLGWWGKTLVRAVQSKSDKIRFVKGATGRRALAEDFAREAGFELAENLDAVLADDAVKAVVLATPHLDHERHVRAAAQAGKHIFVEKPFTLDKASAERAVKAAHEAGLVLALGHNRRFHPNMVELRQRVARGELGTVLHCEGTMTSPTGLFMNAASWRTDPRQSPAGGLTGLGVHMIDSMIDVVGKIADVSCQSVHRAVKTGLQDTTSIMLRFENGATGFVSCMTATAPSYRFCVYGSHGIAEITTPALDRFSFAPVPKAPPSAGGKPESVQFLDKPGVDTVRLELEAFADAVAGADPYPINVEEMIHGAAVFEAVIRSTADRAVISVS